MKKYDAFISYSHDDVKTMIKVRDYLQNSGMLIWTDEGIIPGTQNWQIAIEQAIRNADAVIVLLSPNSSNSIWVREELGFAQNLGTKIYPLLIKGDETDAVPFGYSKAQWIDIRRSELVEPGLDKLQAALKNQSIPGSIKQTTTSKKKLTKWSAFSIGIVSIVVVAVLIAILFPNIFKTNKNSMQLIEASYFLMGNDDGVDDRKPAHEVYLDSYWIDTFEVTNKQYQIFVDETNHSPPDHWKNGRFVDDLANHPVVGVTWYDAKQYCEWNHAKRLPTEAEWEKAARWTDERRWPWGNNWNDSYTNTLEANIDFTSPVGTFPTDKSFYGVMDMAGNAQEWVNDWYQEDYYSRAVAQNPPGPISGMNKVVRGGAYWLTRDQAYTYARLGIYPPDYPFSVFEDITTPASIIGFRCACDDCN